MSRECVQPLLDTGQYTDGTDTGEFNRQQAYIDSICPRKAARTNVLRLAWGVAGVYTYTGVNSLAMGLVECCR